MRELVVRTFVTLDGVMQAPGGPEEDPTGGFSEGGWSVNYWDEVMEEETDAAFSAPFDLLLGRRTYEIFAAHWPFAEGPVASAMNGASKYVASRSLSSVEWSGSELLEGDAGSAIRALKQGDGPEIQVHGSASLIQTLLEQDLVDEFRLMVFPVVVGPGKRLFAEGTLPRGLEMVGSKTTTAGVLIASYRSAGRIEHGSFAHEDPTEAELARREALEG